MYVFEIIYSSGIGVAEIPCIPCFAVSHLSFSVNDMALVVCKRPWWEHLLHRDWPIPRIGGNSEGRNHKGNLNRENVI